ncbi:MAG: hypothetical protein A2235_00720 [Deltaproteobacteria bacterium RIFOXYA2_FULL_42_10]|nr:MAG: hypothetical protein A2235_00720 [Deltaproteobacteria bacterium RIFOXYA2_FULL_42_10]
MEKERKAASSGSDFDFAAFEKEAVKADLPSSALNDIAFTVGDPSLSRIMRFAAAYLPSNMSDQSLIPRSRVE